MPQLEFFAVHEDLRQVFDFLYGETDFHVFELYSEFGQEIREFKSFSELDGAFEIGHDKRGRGFAILLSLWSPSVMTDPHIVRVKLDPKLCNGFTFRYTMGGFGAVQFYLGGLCERDKVVTKTHFGHSTERGARSCGYRSGVDWKALSKLSNRFRYHVSKRLAVAKAPGRPVLSAAYEMYLEGCKLKEAAECSWWYEPVVNDGV
ncbi:MAG TPA: hypothetical protein VE988_06085 [Gemmataceae bacterium]|nr:hypothetical protein [Gemmataceae bacterium]